MCLARKRSGNSGTHFLRPRISARHPLRPQANGIQTWRETTAILHEEVPRRFIFSSRSSDGPETIGNRDSRSFFRNSAGGQRVPWGTPPLPPLSACCLFLSLPSSPALSSLFLSLSFSLLGSLRSLSYTRRIFSLSLFCFLFAPLLHPESRTRQVAMINAFPKCLHGETWNFAAAQRILRIRGIRAARERVPVVHHANTRDSPLRFSSRRGGRGGPGTSRRNWQLSVTRALGRDEESPAIWCVRGSCCCVWDGAYINARHNGMQARCVSPSFCPALRIFYSVSLAGKPLYEVGQWWPV